MKWYESDLKSNAPYSQSRHHVTEKKDKEPPLDYERRTWPNRLHTDSDGYVFIPPMAFKNCLADTAKFLSIQIPGKGKSTYTKHIEAGLQIFDPCPIYTHKGERISASSVGFESLFLPSSGIRGDGKRVDRLYPLINDWVTTVRILVIDHTVTADVLEHHLRQGGELIGIGRFRPRNNGYYGRFRVTAFREVTDALTGAAE